MAFLCCRLCDLPQPSEWPQAGLQLAWRVSSIQAAPGLPLDRAACCMLLLKACMCSGKMQLAYLHPLHAGVVCTSPPYVEAARPDHNTRAPPAGCPAPGNAEVTPTLPTGLQINTTLPKIGNVKRLQLGRTQPVSAGVSCTTQQSLPAASCCQTVVDVLHGRHLLFWALLQTLWHQKACKLAGAGMEWVHSACRLPQIQTAIQLLSACCSALSFPWPALPQAQNLPAGAGSFIIDYALQQGQAMPVDHICLCTPSGFV